MKVYFTTNSKNNDNENNTNTIIKLIKELGHSLDTHLSVRPPQQQSPQDYIIDTEAASNYKHVVATIKKCDFVIAEMTEQSASVGYEVAFALGEKKPVLVLYDENKVTNFTALFGGNKSRHLKIKKYRSEKEIESSIRFFINDVNEILDTKFILIIPSSIDQYLEWNVKERGIPKAEVTREAIEKAINDDERYQSYLRSHEIA